MTISRSSIDSIQPFSTQRVLLEESEEKLSFFPSEEKPPLKELAIEACKKGVFHACFRMRNSPGDVKENPLRLIKRENTTNFFYSLLFIKKNLTPPLKKLVQTESQHKFLNHLFSFQISLSFKRTTLPLLEAPRIEIPPLEDNVSIHKVNKLLIQKKIKDTIKQLQLHITSKEESLIDETLLFLKMLTKLTTFSEKEQDTLLLDYAKAINDNIKQIGIPYQKKLIYHLKTLLFSTFSFKENLNYLTETQEDLNSSLRTVIENYQKTLSKTDFGYELDAMLTFLDKKTLESMTFKKEDFVYLGALLLGVGTMNLPMIGKAIEYLGKKASKEFQNFSKNSKINQIVTLETYNYALIHLRFLENKEILKTTFSELKKILSIKEAKNGCFKALHTIALYSECEETKKEILKLLNITELKPSFMTQELLFEAKLKEIYEALLKENPLFFSTLSKEPRLEEISKKALSKGLKEKIASYMGEEEKELYCRHFCRYLFALREGVFISPTTFSIENLYTPCTVPEKRSKNLIPKAQTAVKYFKENKKEFEAFTSKLILEIETLIEDHSEKRVELSEKMEELLYLSKNTNSEKDLEKIERDLSQKRVESEKRQQEKILGQLKQNFNQLKKEIESQVTLFLKNNRSPLDDIPTQESLKNRALLSIDQFFALKQLIHQERETEKVLYITEVTPLDTLLKEFDKEIEELLLKTDLEVKLDFLESDFERDLLSFKHKFEEEFELFKKRYSEETCNKLDFFYEDLKYYWNCLKNLTSLTESFKKLNGYDSSNTSIDTLNFLENRVKLVENRLKTLESELRDHLSEYATSVTPGIIKNLFKSGEMTQELFELSKKCLLSFYENEEATYFEMIEFVHQTWVYEKLDLIKELLKAPSIEDVITIKECQRAIEVIQEDQFFDWKGEDILKEATFLIETHEKERLKSELNRFNEEIEAYLTSLSLEFSYGVSNEIKPPFGIMKVALESLRDRYVFVDKGVKAIFEETYLKKEEESALLNGKISEKKELEELKRIYEKAFYEIETLSHDSVTLLHLPIFMEWQSLSREEYSVKTLQKHYMKKVLEGAKRWRCLRDLKEVKRTAYEIVNYGKVARVLDYEKSYTHTLCQAVNELKQEIQIRLAKTIKEMKGERSVVELIINSVAPLNRDP